MRRMGTGKLTDLVQADKDTEELLNRKATSGLPQFPVSRNEN